MFDIVCIERVDDECNKDQWYYAPYVATIALACGSFMMLTRMAVSPNGKLVDYVLDDTEGMLPWLYDNGVVSMVEHAIGIAIQNL